MNQYIRFKYHDRHLHYTAFYIKASDICLVLMKGFFSLIMEENLDIVKVVDQKADKVGLGLVKGNLTITIRRVVKLETQSQGD